MKYLPHIAATLLGLLFLMASITVLFQLAPMPEIPPDTPMGHLNAAFIPTGWMTFIKVCELIGAVLLLIPRTRNLGLLILGPIIVNILACHQFITNDLLAQPMVLAIAAFALFLLWWERKAFLGLVAKER